METVVDSFGCRRVHVQHCLAGRATVEFSSPPVKNGKGRTGDPALFI